MALQNDSKRQSRRAPTSAAFSGLFSNTPTCAKRGRQRRAQPRIELGASGSASRCTSDPGAQAGATGSMQHPSIARYSFSLPPHQTFSRVSICNYAVSCLALLAWLSTTYGMLPSSWQGTKALSTMGSPQISASLMVPGPALVMMTSGGGERGGKTVEGSESGMDGRGGQDSSVALEPATRRRARKGGLHSARFLPGSCQAGPPQRGQRAPEALISSGMLVTKPLISTCMPGG